jgi:hypothetical protein
MEIQENKVINQTKFLTSDDVTGTEYPKQNIPSILANY